MAELSESKMNFAALKRVDPYAKSLLETAAHVALYSFLDNEWDKTDIEGALFVYSRTGEPYHNILIMNRLNMRNLVEPITQGMDLQLQDPFLLYRTLQGLIYGIWFYDKEECVKIAATLTKIVKEASDKTEKKVRTTLECSTNNVDIFSMLTKAQEEYNSKSPKKTQPDIAPPSLDLNFNIKDNEQTPQSVMDFFAKASNGSKFLQDPSVIQPPVMFINNTSRPGPPPGLSRLPSVPIDIPQQNDVKPLLQRLMSNPVHSVEHIEKQQQASTPQNDFVSLMRNGNPPSSNGSDSRNTLGFLVKQNKPASEICIAGSNRPSGVLPKTQSENGLGFLRISDSPPATIQSQQFFNSKLTQNQSPLMGDIPFDQAANINESHRPLSAPMETHPKPALMPPVMFASSVKKDDNTESLTSTSSAVGLVTSSSGNNSLSVRPEPLTKNQLLQAVNYLLKHDPDFINKLHEAYLKSFTELVP